MPREFLLRVVTPERLFIDDLPVTIVEAKGIMGDFGAMAGHEPFLTQIKPGTVSYRPAASGEREDFYSDGGIIEVLPHRVTILAESARAYAPDDDLEAEAREAERETAELQKRLEETLAEKRKSSEDKKKKEKAAAEKKLVSAKERRGGVALELEPVEEEGDEVARLEIKLRKSFSRSAYIQQKKLSRTGKK
ncbi:MAG: hypothetical protein LBR53_01995 [Deltaproteobacteria bacterium]|jgi:F-type H+-transporting ATPase subunit epsilon|nr:hypothetical protein [Deltaproteobacteria bacterium]